MRFLPRVPPLPTPDSSVPPSLLSSGLPHFMDERSDPDFRAVFGLLARRAGRIDSAVGRIRLTGLDLRPAELAACEQIRVLLTRVSGLTLRAEAEAMLVDPVKGTNLRNVVRLIDAGRIEIRSAPLAGWSPDFSIFHRSGRPWTVLVGLHWFARPYPDRGPALASLHGSAAAGRAHSRFAELWASGHDIAPAVLGLLKEAERRTGPPPAGPGERRIGARGRSGPVARRSRARQGRSTDSEGPDQG